VIVGGVMLLVYALGSRIHGVHLGLTLLTLVMSALKLAIAAEWGRFPPPWERQLYAMRRAQLSDLLEPAAWRGPDRDTPPDPAPWVSPVLERRRAPGRMPVARDDQPTISP
jgi:hypothetical protein